MGIPLRILPHVQEQKNRSYFIGKVNPNITAARNQTRRLALHQAATQTQADWNSVCPWRNPGVWTFLGQTSGILRTLCRLFWAFRWLVTYPQAILKVCCPSSLDYRAHHGLSVWSLVITSKILWSAMKLSKEFSGIGINIRWEKFLYLACIIIFHFWIATLKFLNVLLHFA